MALVNTRSAVVVRPFRGLGAFRRRRPLRGLGCDCSDVDPESGVCMDPDPCSGDSSTTLNLPGTGSGSPAPGQSSTTLSLPGTPSTPVNWTNLANTLTQDFSTIFKTIQPIPAGCTQMVGPQGAYVSCSSTGVAPSTMGFPGVSGGLGTLLIVGAIGFVLFQALGSHE